MQACEQLTESLSQFERQCFIAGAEWADQFPKSPWISVEDRQPNKTDGYYVRTREGCADMAYFDSAIEKWGKAHFTDGHVSHWMPIPELNK